MAEKEKERKQDGKRKRTREREREREYGCVRLEAKRQKTAPRVSNRRI